MITKEQFVESYLAESSITREQFDQFNVVLPCRCDYEGCKGWAAVTNHALSINSHMELYAPKPMNKGGTGFVAGSEMEGGKG